MVTSHVTTVDAYLASLPEDRRRALSAVRSAILQNLPPGYEEGMQYGMIGYYVPLSRHPDTYNGQPLAMANLASQKQYMSLYLMAAYGDPATRAWFEKRWAASGKKLDMGKSCLRFKKVDDLALDVVGETIARVSVDDFVAGYERGRAAVKQASKKTAAKKTARKGPGAAR